MTRLLTAPQTAATMNRIIRVTTTSGLEDGALASVEKSGPDPWLRQFEALNQIAQLVNDWDEEGALAPSPRLIASADELLRDLRARGIPAPAQVGAGPNGTILIEWQNGLNYFEIEVCAPYRLEWMMALPGLKAYHGAEVDEQALRYLKLALSL